MTDITPGFTFSGGQLVSANNLNKVVGDAIINDESIDAIKLSEDSVSGAIMGNPTLARADVSDQDYFLIYDTSESKIKKLAKVDLIGTLNIQFEGGVVSGTAGNQTTIDGSTGSIVMETGNIETNDVLVKGDLQVDGSFIGNLSYEGNQTFGGDLFVEGGEIILGNDASIANQDNDLYFSRTTNSIIGLGHNGQTFGVTGVMGRFKFQDNLEVDGRVLTTGGMKIQGGYLNDDNTIEQQELGTNDAGLIVEKGITCSGDIYCDDFYSKNLFTLGNVTFIHSELDTTSKSIFFSHLSSDGVTNVSNEPKIITYPAVGGSGQGMQFAMQSEDPARTTQWGFVGDKVSVFPPQDRVDASGNAKSSPSYVQISGRTASTNAMTSWFLRAWYPLSGSNIFEILPDATSGSVVMIGSTANPSACLVNGTLSSTGTKTFKICHPVLEDKKLIHACIEAPKADLIYRGKHTLGADPVNLDDNSNMAEGTFVKLVRDIQVFAQNNQGWDRVKGRVEGNLLHFECENSDCTDEIDWMIVGERNDEGYIQGESTDSNGKFITETDCDCEPETLIDGECEVVTSPLPSGVEV